MRDEIKLRLSGQIVLLEKAYSKIVYKELRNRIVTPPTAKLKFNAHFVNDTLNWKKIYSLPYRVALDTKNREFQYKLLNRCLVTNTFLCKIGIIPSPACSLWGESDESLEHLFLSFHYTKNFWSEELAGERFITSRLEKCQNNEISRFYDSYRKLTIDYS